MSKKSSDKGSDKGKGGQYPHPILNLEDAFIVIDGKTYQVIDLLKLVVEKLQDK